MQAFVVTFSREAEGNAFKLTDTDATFSSFAGADFELQDAVISADEIKTSTREDDQGRKYYDYVVEGDSTVYYVTVTVDSGRCAIACQQLLLLLDRLAGRCIAQQFAHAQCLWRKML